MDNLSRHLIPFENLAKSEGIKLDLIESMQKPYLRLSEYINQILFSFFPSQNEEWSYEVDQTTGLNVLKIQKDPHALDKIEELSKNLYK